MAANPTEIAWAAGLWDGEGCCGAYEFKAGKPRRVALKIIQYFSPECLERFQDAVEGLGRLNGPYAAKGSGNLYWIWQSNKTYDVHRVMEILRPFLSTIKISQYEKSIETASESQMVTA